MTTASNDVEVEDEHVEGPQRVRRAGGTQGSFIDFYMYRDRLVEANWVGVVQWPSSRPGPGVAVGGSRLPPDLMNVIIDDKTTGPFSQHIMPVGIILRFSEDVIFPMRIYEAPPAT
ncbi:predicted protein [Histoplasma capsulatum H143]|uniref:Uncharacterized protein n=1 Tax=Ajellomyces capsulatus (strain H143) TaxID=544712 RepID=C6HS23_AJECH|nr:predicted protein [Histoplasma capsulatum H143]